jgi:hypothetical protein
MKPAVWRRYEGSVSSAVVMAALTTLGEKHA